MDFKIYFASITVNEGFYHSCSVICEDQETYEGAAKKACLALADDDQHLWKMAKSFEVKVAPANSFDGCIGEWLQGGCPESKSFRIEKATLSQLV